jgi:glycosyltransferase involved in cell wall biosynthesis
MGGSRDQPLVSVILPTLSVREHWLEKALASIERTVPSFELHVYHDLPACGEGWNLGIPQAKGEYVLLFADDLEAHSGWLEPAIESLDQGIIPCPRILNPDGSLQSCGTFAEEAADGTESVVARVPFLTRYMAQSMHPIFPNHFMGDHWITFRGKQLGWPTRVVRAMEFTHHFAQEGRIDTLAADVRAYHRATR